MSTSIKEQIIDRVAYLVYTANKQFPDLKLDMPEVSFRLKAKGVCGRATLFKDGRTLLQFNMIYVEGVGLEQYRNTISHEVAHLVVFKMFPKAEGHGEEFQFIHKLLGGSGTARSQYDLSQADRNRFRRHDRFAYTCGCNRVHNITTIRHNRIQRGAVYSCLSCGSNIFPKAA